MTVAPQSRLGGVEKLRGLNWPPHYVLIATIALTTALWITVVSPSTGAETLRRFYEKVRPAGPGWRVFRERSGLAARTDNLPAGVVGGRPRRRRDLVGRSSPPAASFTALVVKEPFSA
jgi:hypothetical protein